MSSSSTQPGERRLDERADKPRRAALEWDACELAPDRLTKTCDRAPAERRRGHRDDRGQRQERRRSEVACKRRAESERDEREARE